MAELFPVNHKEGFRQANYIVQLHQSKNFRNYAKLDEPNNDNERSPSLSVLQVLL